MQQQHPPWLLDCGAQYSRILCVTAHFELTGLSHGLQAAAASGTAPDAGPSELDLATTIASFPPEVREEVLLGASEDILAQLPPAILAEAQALRQRSGARFATAMGAVPSAARARPPGFQQAMGCAAS